MRIKSGWAYAVAAKALYQYVVKRVPALRNDGKWDLAIGCEESTMRACRSRMSVWELHSPGGIACFRLLRQVVLRRTSKTSGPERVVLG
jgi:hypothetical protein